MPNDEPRLLLFDHGSKGIVGCRHVGQENSPHSFGNCFADAGFECDDPGARLIALIDQDAPECPQLIPSVRKIPLCFGFGTLYSDGGRYVYYVDDHLVRRVSPRISVLKYPYDMYPSRFPRIPVQLTPLNFDPMDPQQALDMVGVFGLKHLPDQEFSAVLELVRDYYEEPEELLDIHELPIEEFVQHLPPPFYQEQPSKTCTNPQCKSANSLTTIALLNGHPHPTVNVWDDVPNFADVQTAFHFCINCGSISVTI